MKKSEIFTSLTAFYLGIALALADLNFTNWRFYVISIPIVILHRLSLVFRDNENN